LKEQNAGPLLFRTFTMIAPITKKILHGLAYG